MSHSTRVIEFALSKDQDFPTKLAQALLVACIAIEVSAELFVPVSAIAFYWPRQRTASMSVPEATMNKYDLPSLNEGYIWAAGKVLSV